MAYEPNDTVASALYRAGVRTFSRSFKFHRARGLYCLTGDCPNCLCRIDGDPEVPACITEAAKVTRVQREGAWPSVERDVMSMAWHARRLFPVGFYYKVVPAPRLWGLIEPWVRRAAGRARAPEHGAFDIPRLRHVHPEVLVIGAGPAGLAAAVAAADAGSSVLVVDEALPGVAVAPGPTAEAIEELLVQVAEHPTIELVTRAPALAIYEGLLVPICTPEGLLLAHPARVVVATGATESHRLFPGNDLPGVWLGRGAARMVGRHAVPVGSRVVLAGWTDEALDHLRTLEATGDLVSALLLDDAVDAGPDQARVRRGARIVAAHGRRRLRAVTIERDGRAERVRCDALVVASRRVARDGLLRQAADLGGVNGAGEVVQPNCDLAAAVESGHRAGLHQVDWVADLAPPARGVANAGSFACLCEDVRVEDLARAWSEGYRSTELLKRYTTMTMGPCQGAMCHHVLREFVTTQGTPCEATATTARPPARSISLLALAAGARRPVEERTALHELHAEAGASFEWAGSWRRPTQYGDLDEEYWAVRRRVGIMDVGTLGKVRVAGHDATEFLERIYPCRIADLQRGRLRYGLLLNEAGHIIDDGVVCRVDRDTYYLTFTTTGAGAAEAWLRGWASNWALRVNIVSETRSLGAINVAGPVAREVLAKVSDDDLSARAFPYLHHREITLAGVQVRAMRLGFVGELAYELHHRASCSAELWKALLDAGREVGIRPHGLETVSRLRLEKGHIIVGQDTDFDTTPFAAGLEWAVNVNKPFFLGKAELERLADVKPRRRLCGVRWEGEAPPEGSVLTVGREFVGSVTSSGDSGVLGHGVSLAWLNRSLDGDVPTSVSSAHAIGAVGPVPFYDPEGVRLRG